VTRAALLVVVLFLAASPVSAAWNPPGWVGSDESQRVGAVNPGAVVLDGALFIYRKWISPINGSSCPSYPTCSAYSSQAIHRHGPLAGAVLTAARLLSEGDEAAFAPRIVIDGQVKVYYPVEPTVILDGRGDE
jgi:hypothetical protein